MEENSVELDTGFTVHHVLETLERLKLADSFSETDSLTVTDKQLVSVGSFIALILLPLSV